MRQQQPATAAAAGWHRGHGRWRRHGWRDGRHGRHGSWRHGRHGTGGTGGTGTGGTGGTGTGGTGGAASITCGTDTCAGSNFAGIVDLPACCAGASNDKCGSDLTQAHALLAAIPAGCMEHNQPGNVDTNCQTISIGGQINAPGCCRPSGTCGVTIDLTGAGGPNFGCTDSTPLIDGGTPASCTPTDGGTGTGGTGGAGGTADAGTG